MRGVVGLSPLNAGLVFLPSAFFAIAGNLASGITTNRFGARVPVLAGLVSMVVGLTAMLITAPLGLPWLMAICIIPIGAAGSLATALTSLHIRPRAEAAGSSHR